MHSEEELDFAYKYPFSDEAKAIIKSLNMGKVDPSHLQIGGARLDSALNNKLDYTAISYGKLEYLVGYVYARMLISCTKSEYAINIFVGSEAKRCAAAMKTDAASGITKVARELGIETKETGNEFSINFAKLLENMPKSGEYSLANLQLSKGTVILNKKQLIDVLTEAARKAIKKGLPIDNRDIPEDVRVVGRMIKVPIPKGTVKLKKGNSINWIDRLLEVPIPDCRHRTVNLILAPYLMTIKGMEVEEGVKVISSYIEKCRSVNPHTNINETYIRYQCKYAKNKGMKPMTLATAKDRLSTIDLKLIAEAE